MSTSQVASVVIKIPKRISRGPTDILKALASTIRHTGNEPDQFLQDDPFLLPIRPIDKNIYSLSKLSGKSTAKFLLNKYPEMFFRDDAEPKVRSFMPPEEFREDMIFDEADVKWCIDHDDPVNAVIAYKTLQKANVELSEATLLDFFEMLCYTNEEKLRELIDCQRDYFSRNSDDELVKQTWNTTGLACKIFNEIKEGVHASRIYSAMIAGLSRYNEHATAKQVFEDFKEFHRDEGLFACAYNGLISSIPNLCSSVESAHGALSDIVKHMEQHLVKPDLFVFNSILTVYRRFAKVEIHRDAIQLLNDMRSISIEPSLYSYQCVISMMCRSRSRGSYLSLIGDMLDYIRANQDIITVRDDRDLTFLQYTMRDIVNGLNSLPLAKKLHRIFLLGPSMFVNNAGKSSYLDNYFRLIVTTESMDEIWDFYTTYVPSNFRPTPDTYDALVEALDLFQSDPSIIKRLGSDIVDFRMSDKIKDDTIFKKDPDYIEKLSQSMMDKQQRFARQKELLSKETE